MAKLNYTAPAQIGIDYRGINEAARANGVAILERWLPGGKIEGNDYVARNPLRADRNPGSFRIDVHTGKWVDFATSDRGGDFISLAAYLYRIKQHEAAKHLAKMLGVSHEYR